MIEARQLVKWFGPTRAIDGLSFHIPRGQIVGFLGPNGAGKSTTLRILTGYLPPTSGSALIAGHNVLTDSRAARASIGYMPESAPLYPEMRVEEYLHYRGRLYGMRRAHRRQRIDAVSERCGLGQVRRRLIGHLSKGNRQRVGLAQALIHEPPVLILDEPTAGLDPNQINQVRRLIDELREKHTVLLSTHILPEVEKTADRVMIVANGRIVAEGTPDELRRTTGTGRVVVEVKASPETLREVLGALPQVRQLEIASSNGWSRATLSGEPEADLREPAAAAIAKKGLALREIHREASSLEAYFVQITAEQNQAS